MAPALRLQVGPDETLLGGEASVQTHFRLAGGLGGRPADRRLQKGTPVLRPAVHPSCRRFTGCFGASATAAWLRAS